MSLVSSSESVVSIKSQKILNEVGVKSQSQYNVDNIQHIYLYSLFRLENKDLNAEILNTCWNAFGEYIARQLKQGRAVHIPKWGIFTFTPADVDLHGVTNPGERNKLQREPVFIIGKDFLRGVSLIPGLATKCPTNFATANIISIRPYAKGGRGGIPEMRLNYLDLCLLSGTTKDTVKQGVERVIRQMSDQVRAGQNIKMDLPCIGTFIVRGKVSGVSFQENLVEQVRKAIMNKMLKQQLEPGSSRGMGGDSESYNNIEVTPDAEQWIRDNLDPYNLSEGRSRMKMNYMNYTATINTPYSHTSTPKNDKLSIDEVVAIDGFFGPPKSARLLDLQSNLGSTPQSTLHRYLSEQRLPGIGAPGTRTLKRGSCSSLRSSHSVFTRRGTEVGPGPTPKLDYSTHYIPPTPNTGLTRALEKLVECRMRTKILCQQKDPGEHRRLKLPILREIIHTAGVSRVDLEYLDEVIGMSGAGAESSDFIRYDILLQKLPFIHRDAIQRGVVPDPSTLLKGGSRSSVSSKVTALTELAQDVTLEKARGLSEILHANRHKLISALSKEQIRIMDKLSYSQLLHLIRGMEIEVEGRVLRALVRQAARENKQLRVFESSPSLLDVLKSAQQLLYGGVVQLSSAKSQSVLSTHQEPIRVGIDAMPHPTPPNINPEQIIAKLQELIYIYNSREFFTDLTQISNNQNEVHVEEFNTCIQNNFPGEFTKPEIITLYNKIRGIKSIYLKVKEVEERLKWKIPFADWETVAFRQIREWFEGKGLGADQAFQLLLGEGRARRELNMLEFRAALKGLPFGFSVMQIDYVFSALDVDRRGVVGAAKWNERFCAGENALQYFRDIILKFGFTGDDILQRMDLDINDKPLNHEEFENKIRLLDPGLTNLKVKNLGKALRNKENLIEIPFLILNLTGKTYETVDFSNKIMTELKKFIERTQKYSELTEYFETLDVNQSGNLSTAEFMAALERLNTGHTELELERFVRMLEKTKMGRINFPNFLSKLKIVGKKNMNPFKGAIIRINFFIIQNKLTIQGLIKRLGKSRADKQVTINIFTEFMKNKIHKKKETEELKILANLIDIDQDGFIDEHDLKTCISNLENNAFFEDNGQNTIGFQNERRFFPTQRLTEKQTNELSAKLRQACMEEGISSREAFHQYDKNKDGFLSFAELNDGLDSLTDISQFLKEKLFAMMDIHSTGLIPIEGFVGILEEGKIAKGGSKTDGFEWENEIIQKMKGWVQERGMSSEEAFKNFDVDFDGFIGKDDLRNSLLELIKIPAEQLQKSRLDRLFRLLDQYKTNTIQQGDLRRMLEGDGLSMESTVNKTKMFNPTNTFDWKVNAIQQIGLVLSRQFPSPEKAFESISDNHNKLTFDQFTTYLERSRALFGFNLTSPLFHQLFAQLDAHKKGSLTLKDWKSAFSKYNWRDQCLAELKNTLASHFPDIDSAYNLFLTYGRVGGKHNTHIDKECFQLAVESITGGRFSVDDIDHLWGYFSKNNSNKNVGLEDFTEIVEGIKFRGGMSSVHKTPQSKSKSKTSGTRISALTPSLFDGSPFAKLKNTLKSSIVNLEEAFLEVDGGYTGFVSNVQFRTAIRKLNLGLTAREIDRILNELVIDPNGLINWINFTSRFAPSESEQRIAERCRKTLDNIKNLIVDHLVSPKDAFNTYDKGQKGWLTFNEFAEMINVVYNQAQTKVPTFMIIKDLFEIIDIRKDGVLDEKEWLQTFKIIQLKAINPNSNNEKYEAESGLLEWESTKEYADISYNIGKNRKILLDMFENSKIMGEEKVSIQNGMRILKSALKGNILSEEKLRRLLKVGENNGVIDYKRMLEVYKERHRATDAFPKAHFV